MTKRELIITLLGTLMKYSEECPIIIETSSDYYWIKEIKYDPKLGREGFGSIILVTEET